MKRILLQTAAFLALTLVVTVLTFPYDMYGKRVGELIKENGRSLGLILELETPRIKAPWGADLSNVWIGTSAFGPPLQVLFFKTALLRLQLAQLFLLRLGLAVDIEENMGPIQMQAGYSLLSGRISARADGQKLEMDRHPLFRLLSLSGELSLSLDIGIKGADGALVLDDSSAGLALKRGYYPGGDKVYGIVELPQISDIEVEISALGNGKNIRTKKLEAVSSLGAITGSCNASLLADLRPELVRCRAEISLSAEGRDRFAAYLALASGDSEAQNVRTWNANISLHPGSPPEITVSPAE